MKKAELIELLATKNDISKATASRVLDTLTDTIIASVKKGNAFTVSGFGTFKLAQRAARSGRNPATGDKIKIAASKLPKFTAAAAFKAAVDPKAAARKAAKAAEKAPAAAKKAPAKKAAAKAPAKKAAAKK